MAGKYDHLTDEGLKDYFNKRWEESIKKFPTRSIEEAIRGPGPKPVAPTPKPEGSFKKGGKVKKTATYKLHKGEKVIPAKKKVTQARRNRMRRAMIGDK